MLQISVSEKCADDGNSSESNTITLVQTALEPTADINRLEKHCHELKHTLEGVQTEIVKILWEKKACCEENCVLKHKIEELSKCLPRTLDDNGSDAENSVSQLTSSISDVTPLFYTQKLNIEQHITAHSTSYQLFPNKDKNDNGSFTLENLSEFSFELIDSPPMPVFINKAGCWNWNHKLNFGSPTKDGSDRGVTNQSETNPFQEGETGRSKLFKELSEFKEKCSELEKSLELMRVEFEKCEDYWQGKLNEERAFFDQVCSQTFHPVCDTFYINLFYK